jgi:hypothetical protein
MPIDPYIALSGRPYDPTLGLRLGELGQQYQANQFDMQQAQQEQQRQNQLRALLGGMTPQGQGGGYAPNQLQQIMGVDPGAGMKLQQQGIEQQKLSATLGTLALPTEPEIDAMTDAQIPATEAVLKYQKAHPDATMEELNRVGQKVFDQSHEEIGNSALLRPTIYKKFPAQYDFSRASAGIWKHNPGWAKDHFPPPPMTEYQTAEVEAKKKTEEDAQRRLDISQQQADTTAKREEANERNLASLIKSRVESEGITGKAQDLMGALAERGVNLPAGARTKQQLPKTLQSLIDRNPGKSVDEIAEKVAAGQIEFGAEKKETQVAAGIAGKINQASFEIDELAPLALDASAKVPRGSWVPMNKLMQMGQESVSDPNLKRLTGLINTIDNAYDVLGGRGGTDKEKRAENRKNLMAADSPETFAVALKTYQDEAKGVSRAASKAMLPRSERDKGSQYVETRTTPDGRRLGKKADGTIEVIP